MEVEAQERAKIIQGKMAADEAMCHQQADVQQKHQEIMSKLALERERQLLELDTAWRKQVRLKPTEPVFYFVSVVMNYYLWLTVSMNGRVLLGEFFFSM